MRGSWEVITREKNKKTVVDTQKLNANKNYGVGSGKYESQTTSKCFEHILLFFSMSSDPCRSRKHLSIGYCGQSLHHDA